MSTNSPVSTFKNLAPFDQGVLVTGALAFIVSFFPWYGGSVKIGNVSFGGSENAWHSYSILAILLILAATGVAVVRLLAPSTLSSLPIGASWLVAGLSVLGTLLELLRLLTLHHGNGLAIQWGGWLLAIVMIGHSVSSVISALTSGESVPWQQGGAATPPPVA